MYESVNTLQFCVAIPRAHSACVKAPCSTYTEFPSVGINVPIRENITPLSR